MSEPWSDLSRPPLRQRDAQAVLAGSRLWHRVDVVAETGSTNADLAREAVADDLAEGVALAADHQSAGRGRLDRVWTAPPRASLAVSVLLAPRDVPLSDWGWLPLLTGLAMVDALHQVAGLPARLKWPNDVLLEGGPRPGKVCGILAEVVPTASGPSGVVGAGLNVRLAEDELPVPSATSAWLAGAATTDRAVLLRAYLRSLEHRYRRWRDVGGDLRASGTGAAYREACSTIGRDVRVSLPAGGSVDGVAEGVDDLGRLLVRAVGEDLPRALAAGDVVHVR